MEYSTTIPFKIIKGEFLSKISKVRYSDFYHNYFKIRMKALEDFMSFKCYTKYNQNIGLEFYDYYSKKRNMSISTKKALKAFIEKVNDVLFQREFIPYHTKSSIAISKKLNGIFEKYKIYCLDRNNKKSTCKIKERNCLKFLLHLDNKKIKNVNKITPSTIIQYCNAVNPSTWRFVKDFILFLETNNYLSKKVSFCIPKNKKHIVIPSIYSNEEITNIEKSIDRNTESGKRNYCMVLFASRYGMRAGDIVKLTNSNIDYKNNRVVYLQEKNGKCISFPLLSEIKEALHIYLNEARPKSAFDNIFLSVYGPFRPLNASAVRRITTKCIKIANIDTNGRHHGSHIFRTHIATSMINDGVSYDVVKSILGHSNYNTINHYAVLDVDKLRLCTLNPPPLTGYLKKFINSEVVL